MKPLCFILQFRGQIRKNDLNLIQSLLIFKSFIKKYMTPKGAFVCDLKSNLGCTIIRNIQKNTLTKPIRQLFTFEERKGNIST
jgi:hypothetical protein